MATTARTTSAAKDTTQPRVFLIRGSVAVPAIFFPLPPPRKRLRQLRLGDHDHALFRHREAAPAVLVQVVADGGILRDLHVLVHDRPADPAVPPDVNAVEEDGRLDLRVTVD